jgi:uncharacterized protein YbjT (DUF2867 family)
MQGTSRKLIAVIGATGQQGGAVLRALQASSQFKLRALTRDPDKHPNLAEEVVAADLNRPKTLEAAFKAAHGVFLVTNFWEQGSNELKQATAAVRAAKDADVKHFIWSTLPNVEAISRGKFHLPHFTGKAKIDQIVKEAGFANHTFVIAPFYYQNLLGPLAPQKQVDGSVGWALPLDPNVRCVHIGDITELGNIVAGAFAHPDEVGNGEYLPLVGDFMSFSEIVDHVESAGSPILIQTSGHGSLCGLLSRSRRGGRDVQVLRSLYLPGVGFVRSNCVRKPNSRPATDRVFGVGANEFPRSGSVNAICVEV